MIIDLCIIFVYSNRWSHADFKGSLSPIQPITNHASIFTNVSYSPIQNDYFDIERLVQIVFSTAAERFSIDKCLEVYAYPNVRR